MFETSIIEVNLISAILAYLKLDEYGILKNPVTNSVSINDLLNVLMDRCSMEAKFDRLRKINPRHLALKYYNSYVNLSDNQKGYALSLLVSKLMLVKSTIIAIDDSSNAVIKDESLLKQIDMTKNEGKRSLFEIKK